MFLCDRVINAAYAVETGDFGYGFKKGVRMEAPLDDYFRKAYEENRMIKVTSIADHNAIVGVTYWRITDNNTIYFGPFAVRPDMQGRGVGRMMLDEVERIGKERNLAGIEIRVVNWRADLLPWYAKMGYKHIRSEPWPSESKDFILRMPTYFHCMIRPLSYSPPSSETNFFSGGCICGSVRYSVVGLPTQVYYCHCSMCRKTSGSVVGAWLTVPANQLTVSGELSSYRSSVKFMRKFCAACGSQILFTGISSDSEQIELCHGTLDQPSLYPPVNHIWMNSKLHYVKLNDDLLAFDSEP